MPPSHHAPKNRPTRSAIPRTNGTIYLLLNRLSVERTRLITDQVDLQRRIDEKKQRLVEVEEEIGRYVAQIAEPPQTTTATPPRTTTPTSATPEPSTPHWNSLIFEY